MNKKLFLFVLALLIILSNVNCANAPLSVKKADFDGLIIDATKQDFKPAMTNKIFTRKGEVLLYGPSKIKPEIGREHGLCQFAHTIDKATDGLELRGVKNPLIIKAVGTVSGSPAYSLVSDEDAVKILAADKNTDFLANGKVAFVLKRKIYVEGVGAPVSKDAPLETRKQEAFIAAFLEGIRNIAEEIADLEKLSTIEWKGKKGETLFSNLHKKVAGFEVDSQTILKEKEFEVIDLIIINFKGQRFIIKKFQLLAPPIEFVEFPKWDKPPTAISGVQIQDLEWEEEGGEEDEIFTIKLLYHYDATKSEIVGK